ncbi:MAG: sulfurtransferase TusA family protein [Paracoccaceae bacterium]
MIQTLDATGLLCPLPVLKLRKRLKSLQPGAHLEILTDDPAALIDIPHFCAEGGHEVVTAQIDNSPARWVVRKG